MRTVQEYDEEIARLEAKIRKANERMSSGFVKKYSKYVIAKPEEVDTRYKTTFDLEEAKALLEEGEVIYKKTVTLERLSPEIWR